MATSKPDTTTTFVAEKKLATLGRHVIYTIRPIDPPQPTPPPQPVKTEQLGFNILAGNSQTMKHPHFFSVAAS